MKVRILIEACKRLTGLLDVVTHDLVESVVRIFQDHALVRLHVLG